ncbi:hypothetical protein G3T14_13515 [Methylobacterium sp. BTF04]|uniref:hypothetical protein n=1 Tax=Methylobacterium sp. BTF04 TaxID=2708300 RepID=UPI0013D233B2|nr:hypothetical protein [Methylobacterium sp. BTF04]NEU13148.1 hypothetical protein [Methylobacterium sp. BTF04]
MGDAARRLRARHARRLIARFAVTGCALTVGAGAGWVLGLSASATLATVCIGLPVMALIHHFATQEHGHRRRDGQMRRHPIRRRHHPGVTLARSREP